MAVGWSKDGAVQEQIDASVADAIADARRAMPHGRSAELCEICGEPIPEARRRALPGVRRCVACQAEADRHAERSSLFNRRGSKDSQLR
ncbi:MAG TPA: DksA/TraR family C4-type zinc finger protein [Nevskiaceae bacterium]|nr:DksA/TraR family C4-type zinc finger protein [Nevskiaceae bacterium]